MLAGCDCKLKYSRTPMLAVQHMHANKLVTVPARVPDGAP